MSEDEQPDVPESEDATPESDEAESVETEAASAEDGESAEGEDGALLSNDEIDALLEDVAEDDLGDEPIGPCRVIDLADRGGSAFKMAGLDRVSAKFALQLRHSLYAFLRHRVDVSFDGSSCPTLDEYLASCTEPTSFNTMRLDPLPGLGTVVLPADLLFRVVDTLFGGSGAHARAETMAEFTPTEVRVAQSLVETTLTEYVRHGGHHGAQAWQSASGRCARDQRAGSRRSVGRGRALSARPLRRNARQRGGAYRNRCRPRARTQSV